ncbi:Elongator subunit elp4 [Saxophila tyrrhenica]|uniref:Elongator complex protein 4 n=1 Tax=Saxophila tyrrhenica TaxID=1690608 RepID=A0AAV9P1E3_9PEZI|nr:Elongator subunit elp4 [Saxophila tyrrhenica]
MAFRKRNVAVGASAPGSPAIAPQKQENLPGVRPSPLTSHSVTSTGSSSLDALLGGHGGLALGSSVLIGENGTTDFAGAFLKYYAAEGLCQGHTIHLVGMGDWWLRELPAVAAERSGSRREKSPAEEERMKIAWRYERLGQSGERALPIRQTPSAAGPAKEELPFCHTFDLAKRLTIPQNAKIDHIKISPGDAPFAPVLQSLERILKNSPPTSVHRLIVPTILSPASYPPHASKPENIIRFLHSLRSLLRQHPTKLTAMLTLPLELYPRDTGLVRWAEILSDGVLELTPFPHSMDEASDLASSGGARSNEDQPQGMVKVHKVPIDTERGEGGAGAGNSTGQDLAFTVSRRKFAIKPFSLPPMEGDREAQKEGGGPTKKDLEF